MNKTILPKTPKPIKICSVAECGIKVSARHLCAKHYLIFYKSPGFTPKPPNIPAQLTGQVFGRLTVLRFDRAEIPSRRHWLCRCDCGTEKTILESNLTFGSTKSCGCLSRETNVTRNTKHGRYGTTEYRSWTGMLRRCSSETDRGWKNYGGRGIVVCDGWRTSFATFYADLGDKPGKGHSIDRKDNDGNYSCGKCDQCIENGWPMNCRWATRIEQLANRRISTKITLDGVTKTLSEWSRDLGIKYVTLRSRYIAGKSAADILKPVPDGSRCAQGHLWTPETIYRNKKGWKSCRICQRQYSKKEATVDTHI